MQFKDRKINKHELELWKQVTKNDKKFKDYTKDYNINPNNCKKIKTKEIKKELVSQINDIKKNGADNPVQINKRTKHKIERGLIRPEATIDLHGYSQIEAKNNLISFIISSINKDIRCILVITGRKNTYQGVKGVIREKLPLWIQEKALSKYVIFNCFATLKDGGDGARYLLLRKKEKVFYE